ncbi:hypothetical protein BT93_A1661 [Corymbia citriodora subsp. variegata]|nr:hypothetical protein BT93_A1661 [Corymbia citriodora subsp. variegata]
MDRGARLRQTVNACTAARNAWVENESNPNLTDQERQEFRNALERAENNLNQIMNLIREQELLVLTSISEVRAFASVAPALLNNRGNLNSVRVENVGDDNTREISRQLESVGLQLVEINDIFRLPE